MRKSFLLALLAFGVSSSAMAQLTRIVPIPTPPRDSTVRELQDRVYRLELAVQELQLKIDELQKGPVEEVVPKERRHFCELTAFGENYKAWGPTQLEARQGAVAACTKAHGKFSCKEKDTKCQENR